MRAWRVAAALLLGGTACSGGGGGAADAPVVDAGLPDAVCPLPEGRGHFVSSIQIVSEDQGFDLDGDTTIDNTLGSLPDGFKSPVNDELTSTIASGELRMIFFVTGWATPPTADDPDVAIHPIAGEDADDPVNPANNAEVGSDFRFDMNTTFDLDCNLRQSTEQASIAGGVLDATGPRFFFPLADLGSLDYRRLIIHAVFDGALERASGQLGGALTICTLSGIPYFGSAEGSILDVLVNEPTTSAIIPDIDVDGDGLERVMGDGVGVLGCTDADGTSIPGPTCPCDPRIVDGYSVTFSFSMVKIDVLGLQP